MLQYFQVGTDEDGKIQYMKGNIYENAGSHWNEHVFRFTEIHLKNCYDSSTWTMNISDVRTDLPTNVYCRAPGKFHEKQASGEGLDTVSVCLFSFMIFVTFILKMQQSKAKRF
jgi:hypothetical protein